MRSAWRVLFDGRARFHPVRRLARAAGAGSRPESWPGPALQSVVAERREDLRAVTSGHRSQTLASACRRCRVGSGSARVPPLGVRSSRLRAVQVLFVGTAQRADVVVGALPAAAPVARAAGIDVDRADRRGLQGQGQFPGWRSHSMSRRRSSPTTTWSPVQLGTRGTRRLELVEATGRPRGIRLDALDHVHLAGVIIQGAPRRSSQPGSTPAIPKTCRRTGSPGPGWSGAARSESRPFGAYPAPLDDAADSWVADPPRRASIACCSSARNRLRSASWRRPFPDPSLSTAQG